MKYLVLVAVLAVVYLLWKHQRQSELAARRRAADPTPAPGQPQAMVRCATCSVHLPQADTVTDAQGRFFCSPEHREEHGAGRRG